MATAVDMPLSTTLPFHLMAKPSGSACNLDCTYCFYLEKKALYPHSRLRMEDDVLEAYIRSYLDSHGGDQPVVFAWQGGEPTLMGLDFFRHAVELQKRYGKGRQVSNTLQTNGVLLDDEWCSFLGHHGFLVGLSLDGPAEIHDRYRTGKDGKPTHASVVRALRLLQRHRVEHNILACVNRISAKHPLAVYNFFKNLGVEYIQFIPIIERPPEEHYVQLGMSLCGPTRAAGTTAPPRSVPTVTDWSVLPEEYSSFLSTIFEQWVRQDVGRVFVMNFEWALASYMRMPGVVCVHQETCGRAAIIEHNGDIYSCDHFVYPEYRLGNVKSKPLSLMMRSPEQTAFGNAKRDTLPQQCRNCKVLQACWGGCPKHRFAFTRDGEAGLHYLCRGYHHFFSAALPYLKVMADLINRGGRAEDIMNYKVVVVRSKHENESSFSRPFPNHHSLQP